MNHEFKRSLYVALSAVFGLFFFILLERGFVLLLYLLGINIAGPDILLLDTILVVVFAWFGIWYGVWMGLRWFEIVYKPRQVREEIERKNEQAFRTRRIAKVKSENEPVLEDAKVAVRPRAARSRPQSVV